MKEARKVYDDILSGNHVYSVEYESAGLVYAMQIYGSLLEAEMHADNLGLGEPELVECNIPLMAEYRS